MEVDEKIKDTLKLALSASSMAIWSRRGVSGILKVGPLPASGCSGVARGSSSSGVPASASDAGQKKKKKVKAIVIIPSMVPHVIMGEASTPGTIVGVDKNEYPPT